MKQHNIMILKQKKNNKQVLSFLIPSILVCLKGILTMQPHT